jgi:hypothetical protein
MLANRRATVNMAAQVVVYDREEEALSRAPAVN